MHIDNTFAWEVLTDIQPPSRRRQPSSALCTDCRELNFFDRLGFSVEYSPEDLKSRAYDECELCTLFWRTAERYGMADRGTKISFKKVQSWLRMEGVGSPVLTICGNLGIVTPYHHINRTTTNTSWLDSIPRPNIQLGLPELPTPGSKVHLSHD